jgi:hypothetical protein
MSNTAAGFELLVAGLKADKTATYADLKTKADAKGVTIYPVMFGRAKAMLGLVKSKPRSDRKQGVASKAKPAHAKRGRPAAGGGASKSDQARELLRTGMAPIEIAKKVGCTVALVYTLRSREGRGPSKRAARSQPVAAQNGTGGIDGLVNAVRSAEAERQKLRTVLERIHGMLAEVLQPS